MIVPLAAKELCLIKHFPQETFWKQQYALDPEAPTHHKNVDNISVSDSDKEESNNCDDLNDFSSALQNQLFGGESSASTSGNFSKAETALLKLGITYEKDNSSDIGWLIVGVKKNILIHPNDRGVPFYSPVIFKENPNTYIPDRSKYQDGRVCRWGLYDPPREDENDVESYCSGIMARSNSALLYHGTKRDCDPQSQFVDILISRKKKYHNGDDVTAAMNFTYVIKIKLCNCEDDVWRRVRVPSGIDLSKLHDQIICPVMGWGRGYHGYVFEDPKDGTVVGPQKHGRYIDTMHVPMHYIKVMDDKGWPLAALLREKGDVAYYIYDLGDNWTHRIILEDIVAKEDSVSLVEGKGSCPPEDSNGLDGKGCSSYAEFLKSYKKNPRKIKMKKALKEASASVNYTNPWVGGPPIPFKPLDFNIVYHRKLLSLMLAGPSVKTTRGTFPSARGEKYKESYEGCHACGYRLTTLSKCTRCRRVQYCSRSCQISDWNIHKADCNKHCQGEKK
jgi:hypothetical protein